MSEVRLAWNANAEAFVGGYKMYWGKASGTYNAVGSPKDMGFATSGGVDIDETAVWYFVLTAYNTAGEEGPRSAEISRLFVLGPSLGRAN
jgi:hypothetical protein